MSRLWIVIALLLAGGEGLRAQAPSSASALALQAPPAAAAKGLVSEVRQMGRVTLVQVGCPENRLTMEIWLAPGVKAPWLKKGARVNVVSTGEGQEVRFSPGRLPRSDYTRPQPVRVLISNGTAGKVTGTIVSLTFH